MSELNPDPELNAIQSIIMVLEPLDTEARQRVINYVFQRLRLSVERQPEPTPSRGFALPDMPESTSVTQQPRTPADIRTLKEQKQPRSANEMCALVAYYLAELAPLEERKDNIDKNDVEKYFKQAGFPLPKAKYQALPNAAKSGYFDSLGGGKFRLNPVGYNLIAHGLPAKQSA